MGKKTPREYCKTIAEEDYSTTTISVLAYISRLEIEIEEYKEKEIRGDRLLVEYSHQIAVLNAELKAAKEMEKQQIEQAFADGVDDEYEWHINNQPRTDAEQYYNETFNQ